jgi:hypothetical protein
MRHLQIIKVHVDIWCLVTGVNIQISTGRGALEEPWINSKIKLMNLAVTPNHLNEGSLQPRTRYLVYIQCGAHAVNALLEESLISNISKWLLINSQVVNGNKWSVV